MKATRRGRKKTGQPLRTARVACSLTPEDAEWFNQFAEDAGFVSRSQLITAVLERLRGCGFSPLGGLRMCSQISHRVDQREKETGKKRPFYVDWETILLRPLPPLPEQAPFDPAEAKKALEEFNQETEPKET